MFYINPKVAQSHKTTKEKGYQKIIPVVVFLFYKGVLKGGLSVQIKKKNLSFIFNRFDSVCYVGNPKCSL